VDIPKPSGGTRTLGVPTVVDRLVQQAQAYICEGQRWVVDIDLEQFFDRVNHDVLMARVARRIGDKRVLKLIRRFLEVGLMRDGLTKPRTEGTPQGGPTAVAAAIEHPADRPRPGA
jgi:RNA-directed DNA polymerase